MQDSSAIGSNFEGWQGGLLTFVVIVAIAAVAWLAIRWLIKLGK